jgi:hypothetical protein
VGRLEMAMTKAQLKGFIYQTLSDNKDREYNCQHWVGAVLQRLATTVYITQKNSGDGLV